MRNDRHFGDGSTSSRAIPNLGTWVAFG